MTHLFPVRLFPVGTPLGATAAVESGVIDLALVERAEALNLQLTSTGVADASIAYATSADGITWGPWVELEPSTNTAFSATPTGLIVEPLPNPLGRYVKFLITGIGSNDAGTTLWADCLLRETLTGAAA